MRLRERSSGEELDAVIEKLAKSDFAKVHKDRRRFPHFDWRKYRNQEVYKLRLASSDEILGLMCIKDHVDPGTNAIEIELLEVADEHTGSNKLVDRIAGCLIAFACRESIRRGHDGVVFLIPKTDLIDHYKVAYGFIHEPFRTVNRPNGFMLMDIVPAYLIIRKYLE